MTLSICQIRAARALLGWEQAEVCRLANLSKNSLSAIEQGKVEPRIFTLDQLRSMFESHGVEFFEPDGVQLRRDIFKVQTFEGKNIFRRHFEDMIATMLVTKEKARHHADDESFSQTYPEEFRWFYEQMITHGLKEMLLIPDTKPYRYAPHGTTECRLCPRNVFGTFGYSVYGDKFSLYLPERIVIIENKEIASTYRAQFDFDWAQSKPLPHMKSVFETLGQHDRNK